MRYIQYPRRDTAMLCPYLYLVPTYPKSAVNSLKLTPMDTAMPCPYPELTAS